jgi:hypothetical protein
MVGVFMIPLLLTRLADICFGTILSFKDVNLKFDVKKFFSGIAYGLIVAVGIASLVCGVVTLPALLEMYNITIVNTELISTMVNAVSVISIVVTAVLTYGKDAYNKMVKVFNITDDSQIVQLSRVDEDGEENVQYS